MEFFDLDFWKAFVSNALSTLFGVAMGIPVALWIDRFVSKRRESKENAERIEIITQRKNTFLQMILESLQKNQNLLNQVEAELNPEYVIFYNVDTNLLDSTSSVKFEIIEDLDLNLRLDSIRYELIHLHRKIELQLDIEYSSYKAMGNYMTKREILVTAIIEHIPRIKQEIADALSIIAAILDNET